MKRSTGFARALMSVMLICSHTAVLSDNEFYTLQYEVNFGAKNPTGGVYFGLQPQANIDGLPQRYNSVLPKPRMPLFQTKSPALQSNESNDSKKGIPEWLGVALVGGFVIGVGYFYYKDCPLEDSLAGKC